MKIFFPIVALFLFSVLSPPTNTAQSFDWQELQLYVKSQMEQWKVPGLALAVVKDGEVILKEGFGVRELNKPQQVNPETRFAIGSITKTFTATIIAMLVEEGKVHWDDPVIKHIPEFRANDIWLTHNITVGDLLAHRTGVDPYFPFLGSDLEKREVLNRFRYLDSWCGLRDRFIYNNMAYVIVGDLIQSVTGIEWSEFLAERLFSELEFNSTTTGIPGHDYLNNTATPHAVRFGELVPIPHSDLTNAGPAGSMYSSLHDMIQWLQFWIKYGTYNDREVIKPSILSELTEPRIPIHSEDIYAYFGPASRFTAVGYSWFLHDYYGYKIVQHGGMTDGMTSLVGMIADKQIGVAVLTNKHNSLLPFVIMYKIFSTLLELPQQDFNEHFLSIERAAGKFYSEAEKMITPIESPGPLPSLDLNEYVGNYRNDLYGPIEILKDNDKLTIHMNDLGFTGILYHRHYDTFQIVWDGYNLGLFLMLPDLTFNLDSDGKVKRLKIDDRITFIR